MSACKSFYKHNFLKCCWTLKTLPRSLALIDKSFLQQGIPPTPSTIQSLLQFNIENIKLKTAKLFVKFHPSLIEQCPTTLLMTLKVQSWRSILIPENYHVLWEWLFYIKSFLTNDTKLFNMRRTIKSKKNSG